MTVDIACSLDDFSDLCILVGIAGLTDALNDTEAELTGAYDIVLYFSLHKHTQ